MVLAIAENQIKPMEAMQEAGLTFYLGDADSVSSADIADQLNDSLRKPQSLSSMRQKNLKLVDGQGVSRCASEILTYKRHLLWIKSKYRIIQDETYGFLRTDPIPSPEELEIYYREEFYKPKPFNDSSLEVQKEGQDYYDSEVMAYTKNVNFC